MANWAITDYAIEGPMDTLLMIRNAIEKHPIRKESSPDWEGNVLDELGIQFEQTQDDGEIWYMRGFIQDHYFDETNDTLRICAEEAWGATDFRHALESGIDGIKVYYVTEEPDGEVFATNDKDGKYFTDRYYVSASIGDHYDYDYFSTKESALEFISNVTDGKVKTENDIEEFNEAGDDNISLYEYAIVD